MMMGTFFLIQTISIQWLMVVLQKFLGKDLLTSESFQTVSEGKTKSGRSGGKNDHCIR